jgi:hypothetical protein
VAVQGGDEQHGRKEAGHTQRNEAPCRRRAAHAPGTTGGARRGENSFVVCPAAHATFHLAARPRAAGAQACHTLGATVKYLFT